MKRLVHLIDNLGIGGAEMLLYNTIRKMPSFQHHVIILDPKIQVKGIQDVAVVYCLDWKGWSSLIKSCRKLRKLVDRIQPDLLHAHLFLSSFVARLSLGTRYPLIYSLHNLYGETVFRKFHTKMMEKVIYNEHHHVVAVSNYVLEDYQKVVSRCKSGSVLYNFISDAFMTANPEKSFPPQSLKKWVAVGSLKPQKYTEKAIVLFAQLYEQARDKKEMCLDIYGEGPERNKLETLIASLDVPIRLKGTAGNIAELLEGYDCYISTSKYEGYGIAPMEALSKGLPLFLSDIPVYKEIYKEFAFYFDITKIEGDEFLNACANYDALDNETKIAKVRRGIAFATSLSNSQRYIKELLHIYEIAAGKHTTKSLNKKIKSTAIC